MIITFTVYSQPAAIMIIVFLVVVVVLYPSRSLFVNGGYDVLRPGRHVITHFYISTITSLKEFWGRLQYREPGLLWIFVSFKDMHFVMFAPNLAFYLLCRLSYGLQYNILWLSY